jgi:hypothetical protein
MKRLICLPGVFAVLLFVAPCLDAAADKDVPWKAQAEIARRGAIAERVDGLQDADDPLDAIAAAMQPPADDSHKWLFTLVTTRSCQWCEQMRRDFDNDARLKAWVDTKDYTKSWAHWQVVQIEDQSQAWRWKDYRPTAFPTLIVQPPVNGSWGDPRTIVFARQGYQKPAELDTAIRKAIQLYAAKAFPRHVAWQAAREGSQNKIVAGGIEQARGAEQSGGWTPPVTPPAPLSPVPSHPDYPNVPPEVAPVQPDIAARIGKLLSSLLGGPGLANVLLLTILAWQIYRAIAKRQGVPLLIDDNMAEQLVQLLKSLPARPKSPPTESSDSTR